MREADDSRFIGQEWHALVSSFTRDQLVIENCLQEIIKAYSQPTRYYHNLSHIAHMLRLSQEHAHSLTNKTVVDLAIFYHDLIYKVPAGNNEAKSAQCAAKRLPLLGVSGEMIKQVKLFIEATKTHELAEVTNRVDLCYFLDFDLPILAADWEEYELYCRNVRKEYKYYPDILYYPGRASFLKKTLDKKHIFYTEAFRRLEDKARVNIEKELGN